MTEVELVQSSASGGLRSAAIYRRLKIGEILAVSANPETWIPVAKCRWIACRGRVRLSEDVDGSGKESPKEHDQRKYFPSHCRLTPQKALLRPVFREDR